MLIGREKIKIVYFKIKFARLQSKFNFIQKIQNKITYFEVIKNEN